MDPYLKRIEKILDDMDSYMEEVLGYHISKGKYPPFDKFLKEDRKYSDYVTSMEKKAFRSYAMELCSEIQRYDFLQHIDYWLHWFYSLCDIRVVLADLYTNDEEEAPNRRVCKKKENLPKTKMQ